MRRKVPKPDIHLKPEHTGHTAIQPMNEVLELDVSSFDDVSKEISGGEASIFEAENVFVLSLWIEGKNDPVKYTFPRKGWRSLQKRFGVCLAVAQKLQRRNHHWQVMAHS